jgi:GT2 family glycosyltransferase
VAQARNLGIAAATGEVCVFVDSGVLLSSGCLRAHLASHQQATGPVAVCGYVYGYGAAADEELTGTLDFDDPDATIELLRATGRWPDIRESLYARRADDLAGLPAPWILFWTCNVSAPTERLRSLGGFDEHFRSWGGEDIDLGYRLHLDGLIFLVNRSASSLHYPHGSTPADHIGQARDNHRYMVAKFGTPVARLLPMLGGALNYHTFNDVILARGLPDCREFLRQQTVEATGRAVTEVH